MTERMSEIVKMALLYLQANREDFIAAHTDEEEFVVNGVRHIEPPTEEEVELALYEFQEFL